MSYARKPVTGRGDEPINERMLRNAARYSAMRESFRRGEITFTLETSEGTRIIRTEEELLAIYHLSPQPARQLSDVPA